MNSTPTVTAYRSDKDLVELKEWFYDFDDSRDNRKRAIERVKVLLTRGRLPHGIEATSILTSVLLSDSNDEQRIDFNVIQLSYTMALIRFVNGLLDPFQQSNYAIPMQLLAKQLNLPTFFVELRHMGTHESLPSLEILRIATKDALTWLYDNYWCHIETLEKIEKNESDIYSETVNFRSNYYEGMISNFGVYENLKTFKRLRKDHLDTPLFKQDNNDQDAIKLRTCVNDLVEFGKNNPALLAELLIRKYYIIYPQLKLESKGIKHNPLLEKLYQPLLAEMGDQVITLLLTKVLKLLQRKELSEIDRRVYKKLGFATSLLETETSQLVEWLPYIIRESLSQPFVKNNFIQIQVSDYKELVKFVCDKIEAIFNHDDWLLLKLLQVVKELVSDSDTGSRDEISAKHDEAVKRASKKALELPPSLDEILAEGVEKRKLEEEGATSNRKRSKSAVDNGERVYLMEPHEDWTPTPFGMPV